MVVEDVIGSHGLGKTIIGGLINVSKVFAKLKSIAGTSNPDSSHAST